MNYRNRVKSFFNALILYENIEISDGYGDKGKFGLVGLDLGDKTYRIEVATSVKRADLLIDSCYLSFNDHFDIKIVILFVATSNNLKLDNIIENARRCNISFYISAQRVWKHAGYSLFYRY